MANKRNEQIARFPSVAALARHAGLNCNKHDRRSMGNHWFNNETPEETFRLGQYGNSSLVPNAEKLMGQIASEFYIPTREVIADVAGAYPSIPDFLMGDPLCMRRRAFEDSDRAPVSIYVNLVSSASVDSATIMKRGVAVLALVMAAAQERPVSLHVFGSCRQSKGESVIVAEIPTAPMDLATACYALTSAGFCRDLIYGLMQRDHLSWGTLKWPNGYLENETKYHAELLSRLGGNPEVDLIIPGTHKNDRSVREPVQWVNTQLTRFHTRLDAD